MVSKTRLAMIVFLKYSKTFRRVQLQPVWRQMKKPTIVRNPQFLESLPIRVFQDDQCVKALRKLGTKSSAGEGSLARCSPCRKHCVQYSRCLGKGN